MKKLLYSAVAFATLLFAACQQESLEPVAAGDTVTYTISVPGALGTKAIGTNVDAVTELIYEVYRTEAQSADDFDATEQLLYKRKATITGGTAYLTLELVNKQNFRVLFWAQVPETGVYNTNDLKNVTIGQALTTNMESYAAFSGSDFIKAGDNLTGRIVHLQRPVAQLNIATDDESLVLGNGTGAITTTDVEINNCYVSVTGLSTSYNVAEAAAGALVESAFVYDRYDENNKPVLSESTLTVKNVDYTYVAMNYIGFAPALGTNVEVTYKIDTNVGTIDNTIGNVPVKPNYRTNIVGNLITETSDYTIILDNEWPEDGLENMEVLVEGLVKNVNGDYEVSSEKGLAYAVSHLFEEGGNFYLTEELYDMTGYAVNPPVIASGKTLNVYGETPVVTRAAASVVTIKGLDLPSLIESVAPTGSASFSNICIDSNATFVGTNNGTVVFDNCANAETDNHEELIGDNTNGETIDMASIENLDQLQAVINSGIKTIELTKPLVNPANTEFTLDLKGCIVSCIDESNASYGMITNKGTLVINGKGTLQLTAVNDRGWNAYSSVVSNTVGGHLTVNEDVIIEHLGGTSMAYGIDNLTNGKGTSAVTVVNGATVKSTYRAIRQFLNGIEATNELYINKGSKVEGANKSIWMQDPSKNANTGKLVVADGAELYGNAYLTVTEGSTSWPVNVSIASSALAEGAQVMSSNVPENYTVENVGGIWKVICYATVATADELLQALESDSSVILTEDIKIDPANMSNAYGATGINVKSGQNIDGGNKTLDIQGAGGTWDSGICARGGLIKNLTVTGSFRGIFIREGNEPIVLDNVTLKNVTYTISVDQANYQTVEAYNSKFYGWTSYAATIGSAKFENCVFGQGNGYAYCRPYAPTTFKNCEFEADYTVDPVAAVTFENCTLGGVAVTAENVATLVTGTSKVTVK